MNRRLRRCLPTLRSRRFILFGLSVLTLILASIPNEVVHAAAGGLDLTFGTDGKVKTDYFSNIDRTNALVIQSDGKIVAAGTAVNLNTGGDFALARYNNDGSLDLSFGMGGKVTTDFFGIFDEGRAVAIQSDGKIVVAGVAFTNGAGSDFALARYNTDGSLDPEFGNGGRATTTISGIDDQINAIALQDNDKILVAGLVFGNTLSANFAVARYNTDGSLDTSFGTTGLVITDFLHNPDEANALLLQTDSKIVVAGYATDIALGPQFALARYHSDGSIDTTFGTGGKVITYFFLQRVRYDYEIKAAALQSDGKIVAAGFISSPSYGPFFALTRYNSDGSLDTSFGIGGSIPNEIVGIFGGAANAVAIQRDGKVVAAGYSGTLDPPGIDFALARYDIDGSLDATFGAGGISDTDFSGSFDRANAVAIQNDGNIVAAGTTLDSTTGLDFALARYKSTSFDSCVQDDYSGNMLQIDTTTGNYQFSVCRKNLTFTGRGVVSDNGCKVEFKAVEAGRNIRALINVCTNSANALAEVQGRTYSAVDRNITNNTCTCN